MPHRPSAIEVHQAVPRLSGGGNATAAAVLSPNLIEGTLGSVLGGRNPLLLRSTPRMTATARPHSPVWAGSPPVPPIEARPTPTTPLAAAGHARATGEHLHALEVRGDFMVYAWHSRGDLGADPSQRHRRHRRYRCLALIDEEEATLNASAGRVPLSRSNRQYPPTMSSSCRRPGPDSWPADRLYRKYCLHGSFRVRVADASP